MGRIISFILLLCILSNSCKPQQKITELKNRSEIHEKNDVEYFLGSWRFVEKNYMDENQKKIYPLHECMKAYTLVFEKEKGGLFLTKNYATGKDCAIKSSSGKNRITIQGNSFSYIDIDLKRIEHYKIISKTKFSIMYGDILKGKVREIEDIYERQ